MEIRIRNLSFALIGMLMALMAALAFSQTPPQTPPKNQGVNPYRNEAGQITPAVPPAAQQPPLPSPTPEEDFSGTVQAVDTINRTMTIRTSDSRIVSRLTPGHQVILWAVMKQTPPIAGLRDPGNRQPKSDPEAEQFTGSFVSANQSVMTLRIDSSRALTNVPVGKEVSMMVTGLAPQAAPTSGAVVGAPVPPTASATSGSAGEGAVSKSSQTVAQPGGAQRVTGTIVAIDLATSAVLLRTSAGQQLRLPVDYNTRFALTSAGGSLGDLKVGQVITATLNDNKTTAIESTSTTPEGTPSSAVPTTPEAPIPPVYPNR